MMPEDQNVADVLASNVGFDDPAAWVQYAREHGLRHVSAVKLIECPGCGLQAANPVGQYVYYSTLIRLNDCERCGLMWADARIDKEVVQQHFEGAYKDEMYFSSGRAEIFEQIATLISSCTPQGGSVLDIGGATGHLLANVAAKRSDLRLTLNDISENACTAAARKLGVSTRCGDLESLTSEPTRYDTVVCSDVVYYEQNMQRLWSTLRNLVRPSGMLVLRVPNKSWLIRNAERVRGLLPNTLRCTQDRIAFFNPEHLYVLRRGYIERELRANGFGNVIAVPSRMLQASARSHGPEKLAFWLAELAYRLSRRRMLMTPSMLITALRHT